MENTEKLNAKIRRLSKRISESDVESNVVYLNDKVVKIGKYTGCIPDRCQADGSQRTRISFSLDERRYLIFTTSVKESKVNTEAHDNYGGIIYILEPITDQIAEELIKSKIFNNL
jgi:hypothetical protein